MNQIYSPLHYSPGSTPASGVAAGALARRGERNARSLGTKVKRCQPYLILGLLLAGARLMPASPDPVPYAIVQTAQIMGSGAIHDVTADSENRRLYVPRGSGVLVFDLDTLHPVGTIPNTQAHTVVVDPVTHHAFATSQPVAMWDARTLRLIKTIPVGGDPDGVVCDSAAGRVFVLSHSAPNVTALDTRSGAVLGTVDLGGEPEQAQVDGQGKLYVELEDKDQVAVVAVHTLQHSASFSLGGQGGGPEGLGLDAKNHRLFVFCRHPATCVVLDSEAGKILATLPIGNGCDGGGFNPATMEAFSSQRDGTLTLIKEASPTHFEVEQTVTTRPGAKTCTLDTQKNQVVLITVDRPKTSPPAAPANGQHMGARASSGSGPLTILVVGRATHSP